MNKKYAYNFLCLTIFFLAILSADKIKAIRNLFYNFLNQYNIDHHLYMMSNKNIRSLAPELAIKAQKECFEKPEKIAEEIQKAKEWLNQIHNLKRDLPDQLIVSILRSCKYDAEQAKGKLNAAITLRQELPEIFERQYPFDEATIELLKLGGHLPLSLASADSTRVFLCRQGIWDPKKFSILEVARLNIMSGSLVYRDCDNFAIAGYEEIFDQKELTFRHAIQANPMFLKKLAFAMQKGSPFRIKGVHFINFNYWLVKLLNFFRMFLSKKMQNRIFIHETIEDLHKFIPKRILPEEYGGEAGPIQEMVNKHVKYMMENQEYFEELQLLEAEKLTAVPEVIFDPSYKELDGFYKDLEID